MSLIKRGTILRISKTAASATELLIDRPLTEETKVVEGKNPEFLYFVAKAIAAGDEGPLGKNGSREPNYNGNADYFPKKEIESAYQSFIGKGIYLDHNASSVMYSVGKIIDAFPTVDPDNKEWSISCLAKIDKKLHPEIARKVETGELNTVSMGCSCGESKCSVCGTILRTDDDPKCEHLSPGKLMHDFQAEIDIPEYGIRRGQTVKSFAINSEINFNELSLVGVPAWPRAFVTTILSNLKNTISKKASLTKEEQLDLVAQFEKLVDTLDANTKEQVKAEFCGCPVKDSSMKKKAGLEPGTKVRVRPTGSGLTKSYPATNWLTQPMEVTLKDYAPNQNTLDVLDVILPDGREESIYDFNIIYPEAVLEDEDIFSAKESAMSDLPQKQSNDETTDLLKKMSAYDMEKLENHILHKTRKAEASVAADTKTHDQGWMNSILEKAKNTAAGKVFAKTIQRLAEDDKFRLPPHSQNTNNPDKSDMTERERLQWDRTRVNEFGKNRPTMDEVVKRRHEKEEKMIHPGTASLTAAFSVNQAEPMKSSWALLDGSDKVILDASLHEIWGDQFEANQDFAVSGEYGRAIAARYLDPKLGGVEKLADLWDVSYKLNKEANMEKQANPGDVKKPEGKFFVPGSDSTNKWNDKKVKIEYNISEPKPGADQKGPAAPAHADVKTEYELGKPEGKPFHPTDAPNSSNKVKVEYNLGKPEGKKINPANPDEKAHEKSEKEVKTGYKGDLMYDEEKKLDEKGGKKESSIKTAKTVGDAPEGSVEESQYPKASEPNKDPEASVAENNMPKGTPDLTKTPDSSVAEKMPAPAKSDKDPETSVKDTKFEKHPNLTSEPDSSVDKNSSQKVASDMCAKCSQPMEACACMAAKEDVAPEMDAPVDAPKPEVGSAFDKVEEKLTIGDGYDASKDKETKEIIISKDGKEMKRLPDGFGADIATVTSLLKAVLGLPVMEEKKDEKPGEALSPVDEVVEKVEVHPEQSSPSETPSLKASALEVELTKKAEELKAKEEELNKKAEEIKKFEMEKQAAKFADAVSSRTNRCRRVIEAMLEKNVLSMNDEVLKEQLQNGTYLLDARKAALDHAISAKLKELMASDDVALAAIEKTVNDIKLPEAEVSKKASRVPFIQWENVTTQEDELKAIFSQMGKKNHWQ